MKILLTGATSQQANPEAHRRAVNFTGLVWDTLRQSGRDEVFWKEPSCRWDESELSAYDHVIVGLAPLMAMGANRLYGALSVVSHLWDSGRLTLLLDSPDPALFTRNLRSVLDNPSGLTKPFFSYRKEYSVARDPGINHRILLTVEQLAHGRWPCTVVPALPWTDLELIASRLPLGASKALRTANLDYLVLDRFAKSGQGVPRLREWSVAGASDRRWLPSLNLGLPVRDLPQNHRIPTDQRTAVQLRESVGLLVGPICSNTWWTPRIAMALAQGTPVFTEWRKSQMLGPEWAELPGPHELAGNKRIVNLAEQQLASYIEAIPDKGQASSLLLEAAGVKNRPRKTGAISNG